MSTLLDDLQGGNIAVDEDPTANHIRYRIKELIRMREDNARKLKTLQDEAARNLTQQRWATEAIAALETEQNLLQAWLNTST